MSDTTTTQPERWSTVVDAAAASDPNNGWVIRHAEAVVRSHFPHRNPTIEWATCATAGHPRTPWTPGTPVPDGVALVVCRAEAPPLTRATTRSVLRTAPDLAAERERAAGGYPWCDTCQRPSAAGVGNGVDGRSHVTPEFPTGAPEGADPWDDHPVTHHQWMNTPS